jgi:hypothetical protein
MSLLLSQNNTPSELKTLKLSNTSILLYKMMSPPISQKWTPSQKQIILTVRFFHVSVADVSAGAALTLGGWQREAVCEFQGNIGTDSEIRMAKGYDSGKVEVAFNFYEKWH